MLEVPCGRAGTRGRPYRTSGIDSLSCGGGAVTLRLAALVGPEGEVVGADLAPSILRLAHQEVEDSNLPVSFRHLGAEELDEVAAYDFAYSR